MDKNVDMLSEADTPTSTVAPPINEPRLLHSPKEESNLKGGEQRSAEDKLVAILPTQDGGSNPHAPPPSIYKRKMKGKPKSILKPSPSPKPFSFRRDILQQLNSRLAQQGVNVQVPIPQGSSTLGTLSGTAQGTAQAAGNLLGGMLKRVSGFAATGLGSDEANNYQIPPNAQEGMNALESASSSGSSLHNTRTGEQSSPSETSLVHSTTSNNLPPPSSSVRPLRKVRFSVSNIGVTYPISGAIAPGDEDATRIRVEEEYKRNLKESRQKQFSLEDLEKLYRECCRYREEHPLKKMRSIFQEASTSQPPVLRAMDLSFVPLDRQAIEPIADFLSIDFGLQKLVMENCGLTDGGLKSILHALLVSGTLSNLSLASNKRVKYHGWRFIGIFMRRACALKYLDLSENNINRASLEHIASALGRNQITDMSQDYIPPNLIDAHNNNFQDQENTDHLTLPAKLLQESSSEKTSLNSLRLENCGLKTASLEILAHSVRFSTLCHLSLRRNRINHVGAVALSVMLKDYPDGHVPVANQATTPFAHGQHSNYPMRQARSLESPKRTTSSGNSTNGGQNISSPSSEYPMVYSSPAGGVTRRTLPILSRSNSQEISIAPGEGCEQRDMDVSNTNGDLHSQRRHAVPSNGIEDYKHSEEAARALRQAQRAKQILASMPKIGNLLTLDLKGNDIRSGVTYLSQALKKNRTLKVLNLSDNNIEMLGLVAIADALKYNSTLETLDLSHNPCSGPGLEGITTLRTAFTLNSNLKRLFLADTEMSSEGAIALAEFLPEAKSLIHLDLTHNYHIDIAGVMALAASVKMNRSLRCMDLNIPPNAPDFARLSQDILNSCIRNTEFAQQRAQQRGVKNPIPAPIYKSTLARAAKEKEERNRIFEASKRLDQSPVPGDSHNSFSSQDATESHVSALRVINAAQECVLVLRELIEREKEQEKERVKEREASRRADGSSLRPVSDFANDLMAQSRHLRSKLRNVLGTMHDGDDLERALHVNDELESITSQLKKFYAGVNNVGDVKDIGEMERSTSAFLEVPAQVQDSGISSPNFSIGSDDEDDDVTTHNKAATSYVVENVSEALSGLDIHGPLQGRKAAREEPVEDESKEVDPDAEFVNSKAKGQLSEEGEIFRRAKSLSIGQENDDEAGQIDGKELSNELKPLTIDTSISASSTSPNTQSEHSSQSSSHTLSPSDDRKEVSGEELRKELLETEVPRRSQDKSIADIPQKESALETNEIEQASP